MCGNSSVLKWKQTEKGKMPPVLSTLRGRPKKVKGKRKSLQWRKKQIRSSWVPKVPLTPRLANKQAFRTPPSSHKKIRKKMRYDTDTESECRLYTDDGDDNDGGVDRLIDDQSDDTIDCYLKELNNILPAALTNFQKGGVLKDILELFSLVSQDKFPLTNIAFLLALDVIRWYSQESTTKMTYSTTTKQWWRIGYLMFGGKYLRFHSGLKHLGKVVSGSTTKGNFVPEDGAINFAVPAVNIIRKAESVNVPHDLRPGVIDASVNVIAKANNKNTAYSLSFDEKKLIPGFTPNSGDADLFGYEPDRNLQQQKNDLLHDLSLVEELDGFFNTIIYDDIDTYNDIPSVIKGPLIGKIMEVLYIMSKRMSQIRKKEVRQKLALQKFLNIAGDNWRDSRHLFVISSIQASLFEISDFLKTNLTSIDNLCNLASKINGTSHNYSITDSVDVADMDNVWKLKEPNELPPEYNSPIFMKQSTEEWLRWRLHYRVTGSTIHKAIGLSTLKEQQCHFDQHVLGKEAPVPSEQLQKLFDHGKMNEKHAVATIVSKVLPVMYPAMKFVEIGGIPMDVAGIQLLEVSPDGALCEASLPFDHFDPTRQSRIAIEIKCPYPSLYKPPVHYEFPKYYVCQCLSEMALLNVTELLYISYSDTSSAVFLLEFDDELWEEVFQAVGKYAVPSRPTKTNPMKKEILEKIELYITKHVKFVMEVPSVRCQSSQPQYINTSSLYDSPYHHMAMNGTGVQEVISERTFSRIIEKSQSSIKEAYELSREPAREIIVWMLSDINRRWDPEKPLSLPICFGLRGYKLSMETMRKINEHLMQTCHDRGIKVVNQSSDGAFHQLIVRDGHSRPLTVMQLERDVAAKVKKMTKSSIISAIKKKLHVQHKAGSDSDKRAPYNFPDDYVIRSTQSSKGKVVHVSLCDTSITRIKYPSNQNARNSNARNKDQDTSKDIQDTRAMNDVYQDAIPDTVWARAAEEEDSHLLESMDILCHEIESESVENWDEEQETNHLQITQNGTDIGGSRGMDNDPISSQQPVDHDGNIVDYILTLLKSLNSAKWNNCSRERLKAQLRSCDELAKMTHKELDCVLDATKDVYQRAAKKSWRKDAKISYVTGIFGMKQVKSLHDIAREALPIKIDDLSKVVLNAMYATCIWPEEYDRWTNASHISGFKLDGFTELSWFYHPEYNEAREQTEIKTVDGDHLLVNLRVRACSKGLGPLKKHCLVEVAKEGKTHLNLGMVEDLLDRQCNAFARTTFSEDVENELHRFGYPDAANVVSLVRRWYEAEDDPGLSASERTTRRLDMRNYLLAHVNFGNFPINHDLKGFSTQSFEMMLCSIESHLLLYKECPAGSYNQRAIGSLDVENIFSVLTEMSTSRGIKSTEASRLLSSATEVMVTKMDKEKPFIIHTCNSTVYPQHPAVSMDCESANHTGHIDHNESNIIKPRDHTFDMEARKRCTTVAKKIAKISAPRDQARGGEGVRLYHRTNETLILPTTRLSREMKDPKELLALHSNSETVT